MKPMLKIELERAFTSISFKIAVIIGMAVSVLEFVRKVIPAAANPVMYFKPYADNMPLNVHNMWLAGSRDMYYEVFLRILPILVVLPYAATYYTDSHRGLIKNYYTRTNKADYIIAKFTAVFITGGLVAVIPVIFSVMATSAVLPSFIWPNGNMSYQPSGMWISILYTHPYVYYIMYIVLQFVCSGMLATIPLIISPWVNNSFIVLLFPVVLCEFLNVVTGWSSVSYIKALAPKRVLSINQLAPNYWQSYVIFILVILFFNIISYVLRGIKDETLY